jgi:ParB family chromosome partitioning protein
MEIKISDIVISEHRREADPGKVLSLADSINQVGLLHPITVCRVGKKYRLLAGLHRVEAFKALSCDKIPATALELDYLHRELGEIDDNLLHAALTPLEEALQVARRKEIDEGAYPETKLGAVGGRHPKQVRQNGEAAERFTVDPAKKSGKGEKTTARQAQSENLIRRR